MLKNSGSIPDTLSCAGAGASCVYSLLAAKKMGWRMRATETDPTNYRLAARNVETNQLTASISLVQVAPTEIFTPAVLGGEKEERIVYDFSMCNPPFFTDEKQTDEESFLIEVFSLRVPYLFYWARFV
jgi:23S rRNA A1618 N6-methylase RlmF